MKRQAKLLFAMCLFGSVGWAHGQSNLQWTYSTPLPVTTNAWRREENLLNGVTGESLWILTDEGFPQGAQQRKVFIWLDSVGQPNIELTRSYTNTAAEPLWVDAQRAVVIIDPKNQAKPFVVMEMEKATNGVTIREYQVLGSDAGAGLSTASASGFFTLQLDGSQFTVRHYRFGSNLAPPLLLYRVETNDLHVSWESEKLVRYYVESSADLKGWTSVVGPLTGTGVPISYSERLAAPIRFLRVRGEK